MSRSAFRARLNGCQLPGTSERTMSPHMPQVLTISDLQGFGRHGKLNMRHDSGQHKALGLRKQYKCVAKRPLCHAEASLRAEESKNSCHSEASLRAEESHTATVIQRRACEPKNLSYECH